MIYIFSIILMILYNLYFVIYFNRLFPRREKPLWILIVCLVATIIIYTFVDKNYPTLIFSLILSVIFLMIRVTTSLGYYQSFFVASLIVLNANCMRNILNSFASMWILGGNLIVSESNMYNLISIITFIIALFTFILIRNMLDLDTKFKTFMNLKESIVFSNFYQIFACIQLCIINTLSLKNDLTFLESKYKYLIIITTTCMMLYILMFVFVNFSVRKFKYLKLSQRSQIISEQYQLQLEHYKRTEESYEMFRRFKHDFQGTINVMKSTLNKNHDMEGAFEVLESFEKVLSNQEWNRKVFSKNFVFDSMMQALVSKCKVNEITFNFEGVEPQHKLSLFDKVTLFYNLTSNAITAASQVNDVHKRFINLKIYNTDTWSIIQIENSYTGQIKYNNGVFTTTKEDNFNHGIGIASMREIIKRNGGVFKFTFNDYEKIFRVDVLLPRNSQK